MKTGEILYSLTYRIQIDKHEKTPFIKHMQMLRKYGKNDWWKVNIYVLLFEMAPKKVLTLV